MKRSLVCDAKKPCLQTIAVRHKNRESCTIAFIKQIAWNLKFAGLLEIYHYWFNAHGVCRRYTSMRNPLQAAKRRSCGYNCMRGQCSAKRDLYILLTANGISSPSGNRPLCPCPPTAAPQGGLQWVSYRGVPSAHPVRIKQNRSLGFFSVIRQREILMTDLCYGILNFSKRIRLIWLISFKY